MEAQLKELIPFLHNPKPRVRQIALSNLLGQTPKGSPHRNVFFEGLSGGLKTEKEQGVFRDLKLLCRDQPEIAHDAFKALVNLSDSQTVISSLGEPFFLQFLASYIVYAQSLLADIAAMLLSNLTMNGQVCTTLIDLSVKVVQHPSIPGGYYTPGSRSATSPTPPTPDNYVEKEVKVLPLLLDAFVQAARDPTEDEKKAGRARKAKLHFLSSVFANVTTIPAGRSFFLTPSPTHPLESPSNNNTLEYPLSKVIIFTDHSDLIRRGGVASILKNCSFHQSSHKAMLSAESESLAIPPSTVTAPGINVTPAILLPLAGPEEFDIDDQEQLPPSLQFLPSTKKREPDPVLRLTHLETLILLCTSRWGRENLRSTGVYPIVRVMHETEKDDKVIDHIERLVNLLKRDEAPIEEVENDGSGQAARSDDEDDVIQEV
ncbi:hypothetical protein FRC02_002253 [Tulasnella sp. 418]|nr:hypothetical protein FRC02_002253 [Tulasnella sp. 418]